MSGSTKTVYIGAENRLLMNLVLIKKALKADAESRKIQVRVSGTDHWASAESGQTISRAFENVVEAPKENEFSD